MGKVGKSVLRCDRVGEMRRGVGKCVEVQGD